MGEKTGIAWTDASWNPWWGCAKVSPGCDNCYAEWDGGGFTPGEWTAVRKKARRDGVVP